MDILKTSHLFVCCSNQMNYVDQTNNAQSNDIQQLRTDVEDLKRDNNDLQQENQNLKRDYERLQQVNIPTNKLLLQYCKL